MPRTKTTTDDGGSAEVQEAADEAAERGFIGSTPDPTPNVNYTVAGVTAGKPTPETDERLAAKAREAVEAR